MRCLRASEEAADGGKGEAGLLGDVGEFGAGGLGLTEVIAQELDLGVHEVGERHVVRCAVAVLRELEYHLLHAEREVVVGSGIVAGSGARVPGGFIEHRVERVLLPEQCDAGGVDGDGESDGVGIVGVAVVNGEGDAEPVLVVAAFISVGGTADSTEQFYHVGKLPSGEVGLYETLTPEVSVGGEGTVVEVIVERDAVGVVVDSEGKVETVGKANEVEVDILSLLRSDVATARGAVAGEHKQHPRLPLEGCDSAVDEVSEQSERLQALFEVGYLGPVFRQRERGTMVELDGFHIRKS